MSVKEIFHGLFFLIFTMGLILCMAVGLFMLVPFDKVESKPSQIQNELITLYTKNYVKTINPIKKVELELTLRRLSEHYGCKPTAMPDLRLRCKQKISEEEKDIIIKLVILLGTK